MAGLALPSLYAQVERDFADLEQRREYLQGLVAQQQQLIADLERTFTVPPTDSIALQAQLEKLDEEGVETSQILAEQRGVMSESQKQAFLSDMRAQGGLNRVTKALEENQGLTRAAYDARVELYRQGLISMGVPAAEARAEADRVTAARVGAGDFAAPGISRERQREMSELEETARVLRQRGPEGIRGGQAGEEEITRRVNAQAAEGTGFATEEDAYQAALAALADGVMDLDGRWAHIGMMSVQTLKPPCFRLGSGTRNWLHSPNSLPLQRECPGNKSLPADRQKHWATTSPSPTSGSRSPATTTTSFAVTSFSTPRWRHQPVWRQKTLIGSAHRRA
jgi:hypothetical protein